MARRIAQEARNAPVRNSPWSTTWSHEPDSQAVTVSYLEQDINEAPACHLAVTADRASRLGRRVRGRVAARPTAAPVGWPPRRTRCDRYTILSWSQRSRRGWV